MSKTGAFGGNPLNLPAHTPGPNETPGSSTPIAVFGNLGSAKPSDNNAVGGVSPSPTTQHAIVPFGDLMPVPGGSILGGVKTGPTATPKQ